jgi:hypothetical protein
MTEVMVSGLAVFKMHSDGVNPSLRSGVANIEEGRSKIAPLTRRYYRFHTKTLIMYKLLLAGGCNLLRRDLPRRPGS